MRERWFGATGRRVPEIAVEGELDVDDALVLDGVSDETALREAHDARAGRWSCARTGRRPSRRRSRGRRSPPCSCPSQRELLELDLTELTYG